MSGHLVRLLLLSVALQPLASDLANAQSPPSEGIQGSFTELLEEAATGRWGDLQIFSECLTDSALESVQIFGNGVGIWNETTQFNLSPDELRQIVALFQPAGFAEMPASFGGSPPRVPKVEESGGGEAATRVICRVELEIDGHSKQVVQMQKGEQSDELRILALKIRAACEEPARHGVRTTSLEDGLQQIAAGALAPEALRFSVHRKPRNGQPGPGFLFHLAGGVARHTSYGPSGKAGTEARATLSETDIREVAGALAPLDLGSFPENLYSTVYTDVRVAVLQYETVFQAREFRGLRSDDRGVFQAQFERLSAEAIRLNSLLTRAGTAEPSNTDSS